MLLDMLSGGLLIMISVILWILLWESSPADGMVMVFTCACDSGDGGLLADIYKERSLNSNAKHTLQAFLPSELTWLHGII